MKTAMQELIEGFDEIIDSELIEINYMYVSGIFAAKKRALELLKKEKEHIQKAFSDGQETPINHPTLPHYSREEYYNDNYK